MDANIVQVQIVGESLFWRILPLLIGFVGVVVGATVSYLTVRWQTKRSYRLETERREKAEEAELQNAYRSLLIGAEGYWGSMDSGRDKVKAINEEIPTFFLGGPGANRLPGYDENLQLITKIPDVTLLDSVMAAHYSICELAAIIQTHNDYVNKYDECVWRARQTNDAVDQSRAKTVREWVSTSTSVVKQRFNVVEKNVKGLIELLRKGITPT